MFSHTVIWNFYEASGTIIISAWGLSTGPQPPHPLNKAVCVFLFTHLAGYPSHLGDGGPFWDRCPGGRVREAGPDIYPEMPHGDSSNKDRPMTRGFGG